MIQLRLSDFRYRSALATSFVRLTSQEYNHRYADSSNLVSTYRLSFCRHLSSHSCFPMLLHLLYRLGVVYALMFLVPSSRIALSRVRLASSTGESDFQLSIKIN